MLVDTIQKSSIHANLVLLEKYKILHNQYENLKNNYQRKDDIYKILGMLDDISIEMSEDPKTYVTHKI